MITVDLNADLGESFGRWSLGDDAAMLDVVTSANVACGFHAGDPRPPAGCAQAAARGVVIGAQVGYRDLAGFGRRFLDVDPADLTADVVYQVGALDSDSRAPPAPGPLRQAARRAVQRRRPPRGPGRGRGRGGRRRPALPCWACPARCCWPRRRRPGCRPSPRPSPTAPTPPTARWCPRTEHGRRAARPRRGRRPGRAAGRHRAGRRRRRDGGRSVPRSVCVHGDTPGAVAMATAVRAGLEAAGRQRAAVRRGPTAGRRAGRLLPCGERAVLVEVDRLAEVLGPAPTRSWAATARRASLDVVPGARTVLSSPTPRPAWRRVRSRRRATRWPTGRCRAGAAAARDAPTASSRSAVRYDGPDLDDVAAPHRAAPARSWPPTPAAWTVGFAGFAPGLRLPRRRRPAAATCRAARPRDPRPAGSVGLAGEFSGVYPRPPRRLAAHRPHRRSLWDLDRDPPALLAARAPGCSFRRPGARRRGRVDRSAGAAPRGIRAARGRRGRPAGPGAGPRAARAGRAGRQPVRRRRPRRLHARARGCSARTPTWPPSRSSSAASPCGPAAA